MFFSKSTNGTNIGSIGSSIFSMVGFSNTGGNSTTTTNNGTVQCVANGSTVYNLTNIVLTPGTWIITNNCNMQGIVNGWTQHSISTTSNIIDSACVFTINNNYGYVNTEFNLTRILTVSSNTTVYATCRIAHADDLWQTRPCFARLTTLKIV